ncbi:hypothetical protein KOR34_13670 [Posidoniimonas corsicana]|uniref:Uncharacterized protein n=1 Tax=Posidoniimonas corsicana TaxID=1938618 RepID=A0A5C5VE78_9BACT|nr:hypothetical protein KOR34_13670 [Posidoniimonas corsicana]
MKNQCSLAQPAQAGNRQDEQASAIGTPGQRQY